MADPTLHSLLEPFRSLGRAGLIPALQTVQGALGYLSVPAMEQVGAALGVPPAEVYGVATFYAQFRFNPPGETTLKVCCGTACHVSGAPEILDAVSDNLKIKPGETTADRKFSLETVACLGCCSLAPVLMADNDTYGRLTRKQVPTLLKKLAGNRK